MNKPQPVKKPWTEHDIDDLMALKNQGFSNVQIAALTGRTVHAITGMLYLQSRRGRTPTAKPDEKTKKQIRKCMNFRECRNKVISTWAGHRMCTVCRTKNSIVISQSVG